MGNFDDKGEEHSLGLAQPLGLLPGGSNSMLPTNSDNRREEASPSPNPGKERHSSWRELALR